MIFNYLFKKSAQKFPRIIGIILLLIGYLFIQVSFSHFSSYFQYHQKAETTTGIVIDNITKKDSKGRNMYMPIIQFTTQDGQKVEATPPLSGRYISGYPIGNEIEITYDPEYVDNIALKDELNIIFSAILIIFTVIINAMAIFYIVRGFKQSKIRAKTKELQPKKDKKILEV